MSVSKDFPIQDFLSKALRRELDLRFEEIKKEYIKRLEEEKERIIADAAIRISKLMRIEDLGGTIRIEIKKTENQFNQEC